MSPGVMPREEGVARVLRGRRQHAEVGGFLHHIPFGPKRGRDGAPLVPAQIVDDYQKHRTVLRPFQRSGQPFGKDLMGQGGPLLHSGHPRLIVVLHKPHKLVVRLRMLVVENLQHAPVSRLPQGGVPVHEPSVYLGPLLGIHATAQLHGQLAELPHVGRLGLLAPQPFVVEDFFDRQQDLVRVDGLDEVVADLGADGLLHDVLFLTLGDHDDGHVGMFVLDALKRFYAIQPRHVLVQKNHVERPRLHLVQGLHAAVHPRHVVALLVQEQNVRLQQFDFVVSPKNMWSSHLNSHSSACPVSRHRPGAYLAASLAVNLACRQSNVETRDFVFE